MLVNGLSIDGKQNVVLGTTYDTCFTCELKEASKQENREKSRSDIHNAVRGRCVGKLMKMFPALKDRDGNPVLICHDCLTEFAAETEQENNE